MKEKIKKNRAWIIFFSLVLIQSGIVGVAINCTGVLFSAIINDLGFRAGDLSIYYTIRTIISALSMRVIFKLVFKYNSKIILSTLGVMTVVSLSAMSVCTQLWQWYILAFIAGVGSGSFVIIVPMILNNWFKEKIGLVIGIVSASSGISGAVFSLVCSDLVLNYGWRMASVLMGVITFILVVVPAILFVVSSPEKIGAEPYGKSCENDIKDNNIYNQPNKLFILYLIISISMSTLVQFANQIPTFALSINLTIETGALFTSLVMIGNVCGKIVLGALSDKIGIYKAMCVSIFITMVSFVIYLSFSNNLYLMYLASFIFGAIYSITVTSPSLIFFDLYGKEEYKNKLSKMQSLSTCVVAFLATAIPYAYDIMGSFNIVFIFGIAMSLVSIGILNYLSKYSISKI